MAVWKCQKGGFIMEGRCRPQKRSCGASKEEFLKENGK